MAGQGAINADAGEEGDPLKEARIPFRLFHGTGSQTANATSRKTVNSVLMGGTRGRSSSLSDIAGGVPGSPKRRAENTAKGAATKKRTKVAGTSNVDVIPKTTGAPNVCTSMERSAQSAEGTMKEGAKGELLANNILCSLEAIDKLCDDQANINEIKGRVSELVRDFKRLMASSRQGENTEEERSKIAAIFRGRMTESKQLNGDRKILNEEWPQSVFVNTMIGRGFANAVAKSVLVYPSAFEADKNFQYFSKKIPTLGNITREMLMELGSIEITQQQSTSITGLEDITKQTCMILQAATLSDPGAIVDVEIEKWATNLQEKAKSTGDTLFNLCIPEDADLDRTRKLLELSLMGSSVKVMIRNNKKQTSTEKVRVKESGIIISGKEGTSFADIVKSIKKDINPEDIAVDIRGFSETLSGKVRLSIVEKEPGGREEMVKRIKKSVGQGGQVQDMVSRKQVVIVGLDPDTTEEDVSEALDKEYDTQTFSVNEIRYNRYGRRFTTALLEKNSADRALWKGIINIGWATCKITAKVDPVKCRWCQVFGHTASVCRVKERVEPKCYRCGTAGHGVKGCENEPSCYTCQIAGHSANSMACPRYRQLVEDLKSKNGRQ